MRLTGLVVDTDQSDVSHRQRLSVLGAQAVVGHDPPWALTPPAALAWRTQLSDRSSSVGEAYGPRADRAEVPAGGLLSQTYDTGARLDDWGAAVTSLRITVARPTPPPLAAVATDAFLRDSGSKVGAVIDVPVNGQQLKARIVRAVRALPGPADGDAGSGLLVDFRAVNEALAERGAAPLAATEWWLRPEPGAVAKVVGALRSRPDTDPGQVLVRDEIARQLHDDPLGLGPRSALTAAAAVAVALAAVGFAVSAAGSVRERARSSPYCGPWGAAPPARPDDRRRAGRADRAGTGGRWGAGDGADPGGGATDRADRAGGPPGAAGAGGAAGRPGGRAAGGGRGGSAAGRRGHRAAARRPGRGPARPRSAVTMTKLPRGGGR
ncbi:hypothetical protein PQR15_23695 [Streptomyces lydicus]|nr:hypothetical protein [Streptomyces lydicus]